MESVLTCVRDLRAQLNSMIGTPARAFTASLIKSFAKARLSQQVDLGIIKAFDDKSLGVDDLGDTFRVNVTIAPTEPINFITINLTVDRIPSSA